MYLPLVRRSALVASEAARLQLAKDNQDLSDRLRLLEAKLADAETRAAASASEAREALRMVADWLAEHQFGIKIFGSSGPSLPSETPNMDMLERFNTKAAMVRRKDIIRAGEEKFLRSLAAAQSGAPLAPTEDQKDQ